MLYDFIKILVFVPSRTVLELETTNDFSIVLHFLNISLYWSFICVCLT